MLTTVSIVVAGFSVMSAVILFFTYAFLIHLPTKNRYSVISSALLMVSLANIQHGHLQYYLDGSDPIDSFYYRLWLFVVPSMFYLFGRWAIMPNEAFRPVMLIHLLPISLLFVVRLEIALPILFMFGAGYSLWLGNVIYGLREQRKQIRFELFFFAVLSVIAVFVLILGFSIPYIDNAYFYYFYSNAIGLAFVIIVAALIAVPGLISDMSEAARVRYGASTLGDVDVDSCVAKLDSLMKLPEIYQNQDLNLSSLAIELGITSHQLSELVNTRLGMGFSRYVRERRVEAAKELLLAAPGQSILSVSIDTGFRSQSNFYNAFKEVTGQSPGDYRKARSI